MAEETEAFEREYVDDHSWELLQEDEHGRLRPLVRLSIQSLARVPARANCGANAHVDWDTFHEQFIVTVINNDMAESCRSMPAWQCHCQHRLGAC